MRRDEDMATQDDGIHEGWFIKAAGAVGDLGNPFYREERQRDVWNEASAVGFQLMLWLGSAALAGMLWLGGSPALPSALTLLGVIGVASIVTITYAQRLGVDVAVPVRMWRLRMIPYLMLIGLIAVGLVRAAGPNGLTGAMAWGAGVGAGLAVSVPILLGKWLRTRTSPDRDDVAGKSAAER